jgi:hypothetical protein
MSMGELSDEMLEKNTYLESLVICIWESEFDEQCQKNSYCEMFCRRLGSSYPIEPHEAFYFGRTKVYTLYSEASLKEEIDCYDVTSLYSFVNKSGKVPVGHPVIVTEKNEPLENMKILLNVKTNIWKQSGPAFKTIKNT